MAIALILPNFPKNVELLLSRHVRSRSSYVDLEAASFSQLKSFRKMAWAIGSSVDGGGFDPSSSNSGRTRLIQTIQEFQSKLSLRIQQLRENLPMKLFFFLAGFYCATAFSTVIGQSGDWDILSAAFAVVVVEGIGALMYGASLQVLNEIRNLITMFNYWKAGLSLGLFLDSFKY